MNSTNNNKDFFDNLSKKPFSSFLIGKKEITKNKSRSIQNKSLLDKFKSKVEDDIKSKNKVKNEILEKKQKRNLSKSAKYKSLDKKGNTKKKTTTRSKRKRIFNREKSKLKNHKPIFSNLEKLATDTEFYNKEPAMDIKTKFNKRKKVGVPEPIQNLKSNKGAKDTEALNLTKFQKTFLKKKLAELGKDKLNKTKYAEDLKELKKLEDRFNPKDKLDKELENQFTKILFNKGKGSKSKKKTTSTSRRKKRSISKRKGVPYVDFKNYIQSLMAENNWKSKSGINSSTDSIKKDKVTRQLINLKKSAIKLRLDAINQNANSSKNFKNYITLLNCAQDLANIGTNTTWVLETKQLLEGIAKLKQRLALYQNNPDITLVENDCGISNIDNFLLQTQIVNGKTIDTKGSYVEQLLKVPLFPVF